MNTKTKILPVKKRITANNVVKPRSEDRHGEEDPVLFSPAWVLFNIRDNPDYKLEVISRIRNGVRKAEWKRLLSKIGATEKEFENILPNSLSSMQKNTVYGKETSERIYEIAQLYGLGFEVFDNREDFKKWLVTPARSLGDKKPIELLDSSLGFDLLKNEIIRIQHNVYS